MKWIKIEEQQPDNKTVVLVLTRWRKIKFGKYIIKREYAKNEFKFYVVTSYQEDEEVTYWMPLPEQEPQTCPRCGELKHMMNWGEEICSYATMD